MKSLKKPLLAMICVFGLGSISSAALADNVTPTNQAPSATSEMQLAAWWWDDNDYRYRRDYQDWVTWRDRHAAWCDNHPRKCREAYKHYRHRVWCRNHPNRCERY